MYNPVLAYATPTMFAVPALFNQNAPPLSMDVVYATNSIENIHFSVHTAV
jgi:hypothetical protein